MPNISGRMEYKDIFVYTQHIFYSSHLDLASKQERR